MRFVVSTYYIDPNIVIMGIALQDCRILKCLFFLLFIAVIKINLAQPPLKK